MVSAIQGPSQWRSTAWSMIIAAQGNGPESKRQLERLIQTYWKPAYYYARRRGLNHHDASDCIQEFFTRMIDGEWIQSVDEDRGCFRAWLLTALRRWVSRSYKKTGMDRLSIVDNDIVAAYEGADESADPDEMYNQRWAQSCLDEALRLMQAEQHATRRERQVAIFLWYLEQSAEREKPPSYKDCAARFSVPESTITNDLHRARSLFRSYLIRCVRETLGNIDDAEEELNELRSYLGRRAHE